MQRHDFGRARGFIVPVCAALSLGALGMVGACTGVVGPSTFNNSKGAPGAGGGAGIASTTGVGSGSAGNSGLTAGGSSGAGSATLAFAPSGGAYRRLTASAYRNSLRDLLQGPVTIGELEPDSSAVGGLASVSAAAVSISSTGVQQYETAADAVTTQLFADTARRDKLLGCKPQSVSDMACFQSFVKTFGRLAWRQPLTTAQVTRYAQLISSVATSAADAYEGMRAGMSTLLQSPNFLFRVEQGAPPASGGSGFWQYTSSEIASRLSYFLTNSTPDSTLLDVADANGLQGADAIRQQAERLLSGQAGRESVGNFVTELFQLGIIATHAKDQTLFPQYTPTLQTAMMQEIPAMFQALVFDQNGSALDFFTTRNTFVTKELAALYGLPTTGLSSTSLTAATLPATGLRAGFLGSAGFLSLYASQLEPSPTLRGKFIRETLLCETIPPPPPGVNTVLPDPPAGVVLTKRQRMVMHEQSPSCAACHKAMDPMGFPLENFDAIGQFRTTDNGITIDASGDLDGVAFNGPIELGQQLAKRPEAAACLVRNFYRYGTGHVETPNEQTVLDTLNAQFGSGGYHVRDLLLAIVTSDGFRYVAPAKP